MLIGRYGLEAPLSGNPLVHEYPNITTAFNAVITGNDPVGFVAMSAICANGSYPTAGNGTSALAYFPLESTTATPPVLVNNYNPLTRVFERGRRLMSRNSLAGQFEAADSPAPMSRAGSRS